jgi:hypothetical protein
MGLTVLLFLIFITLKGYFFGLIKNLAEHRFQWSHVCIQAICSIKIFGSFILSVSSTT